MSVAEISLFMNIYTFYKNIYDSTKRGSMFNADLLGTPVYMHIRCTVVPNKVTSECIFNFMSSRLKLMRRRKYHGG